MFKKLMKLLIASIVLVSSTVVFANTGAGPYLGASIGSRVNTGSGNNGGHHRNNNGGAYANSVTGILSAGYGAMLSPCWYLAGELFIEGDANVGNSDNNRRRHHRVVTTSTTTTVFHHGRGNNNSVRSTWAYGLDILPGYMITDHVLAYLRAGVAQSRFSNSGNGHHNNNNRTRTGAQLGLGAQTNLTPCVALRGEYVYTRYGSSGHVNTNQTNLGVVYTFD